METRPKIKLQLTRLDKTLEATGVILLLLLWILVIYSFIKLPATIPIHFDLTGKPDGYGGKFSLFILGLVASAIYVGLTWLCLYPHNYNYLVKITIENAEKQYRIATRIIRYLKVAFVMLFILIITSTFLTASGAIIRLESWFLPFVFLLIVIPAIGSIWYSAKAR